VASIGPVTSASARKLGIAVEVEAATFDEDGLVEAILARVGLEGEGLVGKYPTVTYVGWRASFEDVKSTDRASSIAVSGA